MAAASLQMLIGTALTDTGFRKALLNGSRRRVLQTFPLTDNEIETIMAIQADSLEQFAKELHSRLLKDGDEPEPLPQFRRAHPYRQFQAEAEEPERVPQRQFAGLSFSRRRD